MIGLPANQNQVDLLWDIASYVSQDASSGKVPHLINSKWGNGQAQPFGFMDDYVYELAPVITHHRRFAKTGPVLARASVNQLSDNGTNELEAKIMAASDIPKRQDC